jgi:hypothetical protein
MKLNLGSGSKTIEGFLNVDKYRSATTDVVFDLETIPWPWASDSVEEVRFIHSLEHMGRDTDTFLNMMQELYRICIDGATVLIHVPHPRHEAYLGDPTHVRPITPRTFVHFDRKTNDEWVTGGVSSATPLAHYIGVDFYVADVITALDDAYYQKYVRGEMSMDEITVRGRECNNVIAEYQIKLVVRKSRAPGAT